MFGEDRSSASHGSASWDYFEKANVREKKKNPGSFDGRKRRDRYGSEIPYANSSSREVSENNPAAYATAIPQSRSS